MKIRGLIAKQALRIDGLEEELAAYKSMANEIHLVLFGIGGPLNDSKIEYKGEQLKPFFRIAGLIE